MAWGQVRTSQPDTPAIDVQMQLDRQAGGSPLELSHCMVMTSTLIRVACTVQYDE
jgi:hypothetical protein